MSDDERFRNAVIYGTSHPEMYMSPREEIERLRAENENLRAALKPFADEAWKFDPAWKDRPDPTGDYYPHWEKDDPPGFTIGDLRAARAVMGETE